MTDPESICREIIRSAQEACEPFVFGTVVSGSGILDQVRRGYEKIFGEPCLAQFDGTGITISCPVIDYRRIYDDGS